MASTKISQLPQASAMGGGDIFPIVQDGITKGISWANAITTDVTASEIYNLTINGELTPGTAYRITDYKSVNWLNGYWTAEDNSPSPIIPVGGKVNPFSLNASDEIGAKGTIPFAVKSFQDDKVMVSYSFAVNPELKKFNIDGTLDTSFNFTESTPSSLFDFQELPDKSVILTGGSKGSGMARKLNQAGEDDGVFSSNTFNENIFSVSIQTDGKPVMVGAFTNVNGSTLNRVVRMNSNGTVDSSFSSAIGSAFNSIAYSVVSLPDNSMIIGGDFTSFNGTSLNAIAKLNSSGALDSSFNTAIGTGFDGRVSKIIPYSAGKILVIGDFANFNGSPHDKIIKLTTSGAVDPSWIGVGGTGFNDVVHTAVVLDNGEIIVGGAFTDVNGNAVTYSIKLNANGEVDAVVTFPLSDDITDMTITNMDGNEVIVAFGIFTQYDGEDNDNIVAIATTSMPFVGYDPREIHTSEEEVIVIRALTNNGFEPWGYSETYGDVVQFMPYCNSIGVMLDNGIENGNTLPDSSVVSGFDLQWDSQGGYAYFDMPQDYPALFGYLLYIYFETYSGNSYEFLCEPLTPGINSNQKNWWSNSFIFQIRPEDNGAKIVLLGITEDVVQDYTTDSLYVDSAYAIGPAYGWMTRRVDTKKNVDMPLDWRNIIYRRWQFENVMSSGNSYYTFPWNNGLLLYDYIQNTNLTSNGMYKDSPILKDGYYQIRINGRGGTLSYWWWMGNVEQICFGSEGNYFGIDPYNIDIDADVLYKVFFNLASEFTFKSGVITRDHFEGILINCDLSGRINDSLFEGVLGSCSGNTRISGSLFNQLIAVNFLPVDLFSGIQLSGDFTGAALNSNYSKSILRGSDNAWYLQYFDGTSAQYLSIP